MRSSVGSPYALRREGSMGSVEVPELGRASILTLMLKQVLDRSLQDPSNSRVMRNRVLTMRVRARRMKTTLFFEANRVRAEDGAHGRPDIEIAGELRALVSIALGASALRAFLAGRIRIRMRSWRGWVYAPRLIALMQSGKSPSYLGRFVRKGPEKGGSS